ncbi:Rid family detoxifying hydrolase [Mesohalobacter halotolerans]|uniref:RidA family protein n=1 Tax=Mesohalobacter halotolerans TaxID=1883405 RepID=A0A4U5TRH2_9FLAO|nr:Rid family detoxifying hydrolase [Mesohalobacter halotolerans]MBS3737649.1 Rid family detoxifying hydrolase [Psychroflexus sp.]TKS56582.1 RidA family protein [Mesohalobacter halotolerans]
MSKQIINTAHAAKPIGPYNHSVRYGNLLFTSGQIALDLNGKLIQDSIEDETHQVFKNLKAILREAGLDFNNVIKVSIFLKHMSDFEVVNSVYGKYFKSDTAPARETVQVAKLPKDVNIEISLIAGLD